MEEARQYGYQVNMELKKLLTTAVEAAKKKKMKMKMKSHDEQYVHPLTPFLPGEGLVGR
jgi:hypothetical protein